MNDEFLYRLRKTPPPEFAARLKARLDLQGKPAVAAGRPFKLYVLSGLLLCGAALAFISPSVRHVILTRVERLKPEASNNAAAARRAPPLSARTIPWGHSSRSEPSPSVGAVASQADAPPDVGATSTRVTASLPAQTRGGQLAREGDSASMPGSAGLLNPPRASLTIAGSGTLAPYSQTVYGRISAARNSLRVSVMGAGTGFLYLCARNDASSPDVVQATRRMTDAEADLCRRSGIPLIEAKVGYDALVLARAFNAAPLRLSWWTVYDALALEVANPDTGELMRNRYKAWHEINPYLPADRIQIVGPPLDSEGFEFFRENVFLPGCRGNSWIQIRHWMRIPYLCRPIRDDGVYVELAIADDFMIQQIESNSQLVGVIPYRTFRAAGPRLIGSALNKVRPTEEHVASGHYPGSVPLYLYAKKARLRSDGGVLARFLAEYLSESALGPTGYLSGMGLVPLPEPERNAQRNTVLPQLAQLRP